MFLDKRDEFNQPIGKKSKVSLFIISFTIIAFIIAATVYAKSVKSGKESMYSAKNGSVYQNSSGYIE